MRVIEGEDVNELYYNGMAMLNIEGIDEPSRNGPVRVFPTPVTSVYNQPRQRVLLDRERKANPFFHLFESLWMLAGRNDVAALNHYITDFGTRFAEPSGEIHGAYGWRWRKMNGMDQLNVIVDKLTKNPADRQAVLQMWDSNPERYDDLCGDWKDRPCNTHVYFRVRVEPFYHKNARGQPDQMTHIQVLDMQVNCRSNDIVFGAYGANAVHFSILQEYMAGRVGVSMGRMYQVSWNYHAYKGVTDKLGIPKVNKTYGELGIEAIPMGGAWDQWDDDLTKWFLWWRNMQERGVIEIRSDYANSWFAHTASPMFIAHWKWKQAQQHEARKWAARIDAPDWRLAAAMWMDQRTEARSR